MIRCCLKYNIDISVTVDGDIIQIHLFQSTLTELKLEIQPLFTVLFNVESPGTDSLGTKLLAANIEIKFYPFYFGNPVRSVVGKHQIQEKCPALDGSLGKKDLRTIAHFPNSDGFER